IGILDNSPADNPITRGTLALDASTGPLNLGVRYSLFINAGAAGVIEQGTITTSGTNDLCAEGGTLEGVTLDGTLFFAFYPGIVVITGGLTLDTDVYLDGGSLEFEDGSTLAAGPLVPSATIYLEGGDLGGGYLLPGQTVTLARSIIINSDESGGGIGGPIDNLGTIEQNGPGQLDLSGVVNHGTIQASNGGSVTLDSDWSNNADGTITATQGATLNLYGTWTNQGTITVDSSSTVSLGSYVANSGTLSIAPGAAVYLGGYFTTDEFEDHFQQLGVQLDLSSYTVTLIGTIDNSPADNPVTGGTLALNHSTGPLYLDGAFIDQGTITTRGSDDLVVSNVTLSGVTLDGTLDMSEPNASVAVINGLTLDTDLNLSGAGASLQFNDGSTVSVGTLVTSATIHLSGDDAGVSNNNYYSYYNTYAPVTVGRGITISGENPNAYISGPIDNLGTVAQASAGQMTVTTLVNGGSVTVANGGTLNAYYWVSNLGTVTVASGGTLTEQGLFGNGGTVTIAAGGTFSTSGSDDIQWGGTTIVDGLLSAANFNLMGGLLTGTGTIQADVTNAAMVEPGDPFGALTIDGNYAQTATGVLLIEIGSPNQYGQLVVTGAATLGGTLEVSLLGWYVPAAGTSFQILTFAQYSGSFAAEVGLGLPHHRSLTQVWDTEDLTLTASD
ncbi:MAG: hypothetical protein ACLQIB_55585, partial [Isosphaeraceae bacterium]